MKDYMYIFRNPVSEQDAFVHQSPEQMQAEMEKWTAWMTRLAEQGKLVGGQPLFTHGKVVQGVAKKTVTDGPYVEGKDIVGGYMLVKADSIEEAIELSNGCPHYESAQATVEIREIMPTGND
jgi:hypothetical protein